ncbi:cellulase [Cellvibrio zantedeschiae]|uniref:Cellulase n=1 Tax=Cellvibrio zantedeschiae TaxID=1237077 RepID=A0ABQ3B467_9GAMM|nr:glycoside hydrolase family 5 protein [Cellvibrio zantedeschiae]GGY74390.1 cellulase [Cellvibrio zantedeschiae]
MNQLLKSGWVKLILFSFITSPLLAAAHCLNQERLTGVNLSGAEFNSSKLPGTPYKDYTFPTEAELTYVAAQGANVIRLPFRWERVQPSAMGALASAELKRIQGTVASASAKGLCVILDVHNYAKYYSQTLNGDAALQNAFVDLWQRMAIVFSDPKQTAFGLMNEPSYMPREEWASLAKRTLSELRNAGSTNMVFIAGGHWSGLHDWFSPAVGLSNANLFADVNDPLKRTVLEVHQYADKDFSGSGSTCRAVNEFDPFFTKVTEWAKVNRQKFFLGEFGMPQTPECMLALERFLSLMTGPEWKGWTYWAAGGWWGKYPLAVNTGSATPSQQWPIMQKYFYRGAPAKKGPPIAPLPRTRKN